MAIKKKAAKADKTTKEKAAITKKNAAGKTNKNTNGGKNKSADDSKKLVADTEKLAPAKTTASVVDKPAKPANKPLKENTVAKPAGKPATLGDVGKKTENSSAPKVLGDVSNDQADKTPIDMTAGGLVKSENTTSPDAFLGDTDVKSSAVDVVDTTDEDAPVGPGHETPVVVTTDMQPETISSTDVKVEESANATAPVKSTKTTETPPVADAEAEKPEVNYTPAQLQHLEQLKKHMAPVINYLEKYKKDKNVFLNTVQDFLKVSNGNGIEYRYDIKSSAIVGVYFGTVTHSIPFELTKSK